MNKREVWSEIFFFLTVVCFLLAIWLYMGVLGAGYDTVIVGIDPSQDALPGASVFLGMMGMLVIFGGSAFAFDLAVVGFVLAFVNHKKSASHFVRKISAVFVYINIGMMILIFGTAVVFAIMLK